MIPASSPIAGPVDLWFLDADAELPDMRLAEAEEARAGRMATPALAARIRRRARFLRQVLSAYLDERPEDVPLGRDARGKPVLRGAPGLHFNLSHSGDVSVLAVGSRPLGIDVEARRPFDGLANLAADTCSPRERAGVFAAPDPAAAFLDRWVLKEAILKCLGTGLVDDLSGVDPGPVGRTATPWRGLAVSLLAPPGDGALHLALAVDGTAPVAVCRRAGVGGGREFERPAPPRPGASPLIGTA